MSKNIYNKFKINGLAIEHDDSFLIQWQGIDKTESWTCLIDGGANQNTLTQKLFNLKIKSIDLLIGTHPDADHIGGFVELADHFEISSYWAPPLL